MNHHWNAASVDAAKVEDTVDGNYGTRSLDSHTWLGIWRTLSSGLFRFTTSCAPSEPTATQERFLKVYLLAMVVFAWAAVLTGAYVIYPWYRAAPPSGAADLSIFSEKNGALRSLNHIRSRFATPMLPQDSSCRLSLGILLGSHMRTETILMRRTCV